MPRPKEEEVIRITGKGKFMGYVQHALYKISKGDIVYLAGTGSVTKRVVDVAEVLKRYKKDLRLVYAGIGSIEISSGSKRKRMSKLILGLSDQGYEPVFEFI